MSLVKVIRVHGTSELGKIGRGIHGILVIFRQNDGILHPFRWRIFSKKIQWIRNFDKVLRICEILRLLCCKKEVVTSLFIQSAASIHRITGSRILVKNHQNGGFQLKIARNNGFLPPWWLPLWGSPPDLNSCTFMGIAMTDGKTFVKRQKHKSITIWTYHHFSTNISFCLGFD